MSTNKEISFTIEVPDTKDIAVIKLDIPEEEVIVRIKLNGVLAKEEKFNSQNILIELYHDPEKVVTQNVSVFNSASVNQFLGEIEFLIQSEGYLNKKFNYESKYGKVSFSRCMFKLPIPAENVEFLHEEKLASGKYVAEITDMFVEVLPDVVLPFDNNLGILEKAEVITRFLCEIMDFFGPSDLIKEGEQTIYQKLVIIKDMGGRVLCQGFRNIFIDLFALFERSVELRRCDIYRYYPPVKNIDVESHALLEIKISGKWVAYDPTYRVYFSNSDGLLLSVEDIYNARISDKLNTIKVHHIKTRMGKRTDFEKENNPFDRYNYNYFTTFGYIRYQEVIPVYYDETLSASENLIENGEILKANELICDYLLVDSSNVNMLSNLAVVAILLEEPGEAKAILENVLELDPTNEIALGNLAYLRGEGTE